MATCPECFEKLSRDGTRFYCRRCGWEQDELAQVGLACIGLIIGVLLAWGLISLAMSWGWLC